MRLARETLLAAVTYAAPAHAADREPSFTEKIVAQRPCMDAIKQDFILWLPTIDAPPTPSKNAYQFDPENYVWLPKLSGAAPAPKRQ